MNDLTKGEVSPADTGTDGRPSLAHYFKGQTLPATSLCGAMSIGRDADPDSMRAKPDAAKCVVCLDLLTH